MRERPCRIPLFVLVALGTTACTGTTSPTTTLVFSRTPDFVGVVASSTQWSFFPPSGYVFSGYDVWVAIDPSPTANAGVIAGDSIPVYVSHGGMLARTTPAGISSGDSIRVWHDSSVAYGTSQAPPGAPRYWATQVVLVRDGP